jgi:glutamate--cysteine ligase catalytic subunit
MDRAHDVDAVLVQRFHWKLNVVKQEMKEKHAFTAPAAEGEDVIEELTAAEVFFGKGSYDGLFKYVDVYLKEAIACPPDQYSQLNNRYFELLKRRLRGEIPTGARFLRNFILNHSQYQHDSIVTDEMAFDMVRTCTRMEWNEQLLGPPFTETSSASG